MTDPIQELKVRAEILHRQVQARDPRGLARLRALSELRRSSDRELAMLAKTLATSIRRRQCLAVVAAELGFPDWPGLVRALTGRGPALDFGNLLCPRRCGAHTNLWYARYEEAAAVRKTREGYLLGFRRQYLVVDRYYIETLGLDPDDPDWQRLGFDWVRPTEIGARTRLYAKLVGALPREAA